MSDNETSNSNRKRLRLGVDTLRERLIVGTVCALFVGAGVTILLVVFADAEWGDATLIGCVFAIPVFLSAARWHAAAAIFLGFLEGALIAAGMILGAIAALLGSAS